MSYKKISARKFRADQRKALARFWKLPIVIFPPAEEQDLARIHNRLHRAIRRYLIKTCTVECFACGYVPKSSSELAAHEVFEIDKRRHILRFVTYQLLCRDCHYLTHQGYWAMDDYARYVYWGMLKYGWYKKSERLTMHFCKVNNCTPQEAYLYASAAREVRRSERKRWRKDWSELSQYHGLLGRHNATLTEFLSENGITG